MRMRQSGVAGSVCHRTQIRTIVEPDIQTVPGSNPRTTRAEGRVLGLTVITIALYVVTWQLEGAMFRDGNVVRWVVPPSPASAYLQWAAYTATTLLIFWAYAALISMSVRGELD